MIFRIELGKRLRNISPIEEAAMLESLDRVARPGMRLWPVVEDYGARVSSNIRWRNEEVIETKGSEHIVAGKQCSIKGRPVIVVGERPFISGKRWDKKEGYPVKTSKGWPYLETNEVALGADDAFKNVIETRRGVRDLSVVLDTIRLGTKPDKARLVR